MISALLLVSTFSVAVDAAQWGMFGRRADAPSNLPVPVTIPLAFDDFGRYVAGVSMSTGSKQQHFNFTLTTSTALTYVAGNQCSSCSGAILYNQAESDSAQTISTSSNVSLFGQPTSSSIITEHCMLRTSNGSQWDYPNQTIIVVQQPPANPLAGVQVGDNLSGLIGLATNKKATGSVSNGSYTGVFLDSIMGQWLQAHPQFDNFTFGMMVGKPPVASQGTKTESSSKGDAGVLHWLQPDPAFYDASKIEWKDANVPSTPLPFASTNDWFVGIDGWTLAAGGNHVTNAQSITATVDPVYQAMVMPMQDATLIHAAIEGSTPRPDLGSLGDLSQAWTVPCDAEFSFGIVVGSQTFNMDQGALVVPQADGTCLSGIEGWTDVDQMHTVYGSRVLHTLYIVFNVPRDGPNTIGIAPRIEQKANHTGAIIGGTVGGVSFLIIAALLVFFLLYRHRQNTHRITRAQYDPHSILEKQEVQPFPFPLSATTPTTVHFAPPESSVGSEFGVLPTLRANHRVVDGSMDVAPPSYEMSEGNNVFAALPRNEKVTVHSHGRASSGGSPSGPSYAPVPGSPIFVHANTATGSSTVYSEYR